jgi:hypothetical protein
MRPVVLTMLVLTTEIASPLRAARSEPFSWGKPGVSMAEYRRDAIECGRSGYYLDVSHTEAAGVFKDASRQLEANEAALPSTASLMSDPNPVMRLSAMNSVMNIVSRSAHIVESARPQERIHAIGTLMQGTVDECLRRRGYVRFKLTREQRSQLQHLHLGSPARHDYLFRLSADPAVLSAQAAEADPALR